VWIYLFLCKLDRFVRFRKILLAIIKWSNLHKGSKCLTGSTSGVNLLTLWCRLDHFWSRWKMFSISDWSGLQNSYKFTWKSFIGLLLAFRWRQRHKRVIKTKEFWNEDFAIAIFKLAFAFAIYDCKAAENNPSFCTKCVNSP
jgi:hypothetical protein